MTSVMIEAQQQAAPITSKYMLNHSLEWDKWMLNLHTTDSGQRFLTHTYSTVINGR